MQRLTATRLISSVSNDVARQQFVIKFRDGTSGKYPYVWLRDVSLDPATYSISPAMKARRYMMRDFDVNVYPLSFLHDTRANELQVTWPATHSRYPAEWLKTRNLSSNVVREARRRVHLSATDAKTWNKAELRFRRFRFDHGKVMSEDAALHDFLESLCVNGIAVLEKGPLGHRHVVDEIGDRIGLIHQTHFGRVFEVTTKPDASNMAYASGDELPYHTDFPSLSQPPEIQMLHMFQKATSGGLSMFVDGFRVAEVLRREHPASFDLLTSTPIEFIEEGFDVHDRDGKPYTFTFDMAATHRTIKLDESGKVIKIQFGNAMRSWFIDTEPAKLKDVYQALKIFTDVCYDDANQYVFPLQNGETVIWANTRLLHARSAYTADGVEGRSILGCYFLWDTIKSRLRVLRDAISHPDNQPAL